MLVYSKSTASKLEQETKEKGEKYDEKHIETNPDSRPKRQKHQTAASEDLEGAKEFLQPLFCSAGGKLRLPTQDPRVGDTKNMAQEKRHREK